ncbi:MAG TPA: ATPase, T2SS/T4P/T4SS family, partial [Nitrososphaera sp.]|nr:ATPase, T2SS/T4P/T4SS family [Nitrososphaera sp.]
MGSKDSLMGRLLGGAEKFTDKQVAETLAMLVDHGVKRGATDIHIEPHERFVLVRYRIDGALRGIHKLPRAALVTVMSQLKTLAGLNIQETRMPQEGEYSVEADGKQIGVHLATMPVYGGEKAVLHLSAERGDPVDLSALGFWGESLKTLKGVLAHPHGLIVVAGPRHSGLSSTLFSLLKDLNSPLASVATVETGAKHRLPGINQTYLSGGMSMHEGLQAALKQDPNIIMLDDVPEGETAALAVRAATTGHLVLAGLHAEGSIAALLRLRHTGVEPFLLISGLRAGVGQRLVRQLCPDCRERYQISSEEREQLEESFGMSSPSARKRLHELEKSAAPSIFGDVKQLNSTPSQVTHLWRPAGGGCDSCDHSGYQGRTAIVEVLKNSDALHKALLSKEPLSAGTIQNMILKDGFVPMGL